MKLTQINNNMLKIFTISAAHMSHDIFTGFLSPLLPILISKFSLSYTLAGFLSVMLRLPSLANPFIGILADKLSLKFLVISAPTVTAVSMCLIGIAPNYYILLLLLLITGFSSACFHVPAPVIIKRLSKKRVGASMSSFQIGGEAARSLGPLIAVTAISLWTISGLYKLIPIGLIMSSILFVLLKDLKFKPIESNKSKNNPISETIKKHRKLFICIFGILLTKSFTATLLNAYLPTYLTTIGKPLWLAGASLSIIFSSAVLGVLLTGTISDKIGRKKMLVITTSLTPIIMLLLLFSKSYFFVLFLVLIGIFAFSSTPVILALVQDSCTDYPSVANGIYMSLNFILSSTMILSAGTLSDIIGIKSAFITFGILSFIGIPFSLFLPAKQS